MRRADDARRSVDGGGGAVKYGIPLGMLNPRAWVEVTEAADRLGFESVWLPEHLVLPVEIRASPYAGQEHPPIPPETPVYDAPVYLAFLAARTERIHFGTHVYNIGLRHPFSTARAVMTLDIVSGGRVEFGIGASWLEAEWEAVGLDFSTRGSRVDEAIEVCRRLWSEDTVEHHGRWFDFAPVCFEPKPVQKPWPRLHIGGDGPAALRRAATVGDGWIPMNHSLEELPASLTRLRALRDAAGREGETEVTLGGTVHGPEDVERYREAGVHRLLVSPWRRTSDALESMQRFADEVLHA
jgi:probable F420-dependent oxidoreductase